jgi:hypothetical protein
MSKLEGDGAVAFYCGVAAKETEMILKSLPKMVEITGIEALILDPIQFFAPKKLTSDGSTVGGGAIDPQ